MAPLVVCYRAAVCHQGYAPKVPHGIYSTKWTRAPGRRTGAVNAVVEQLIYDDAGQLVTGTSADHATPTGMTTFPGIDALTARMPRRS
jgi:hypothetical protein